MGKYAFVFAHINIFCVILLFAVEDVLNHCSIFDFNSYLLFISVKTMGAFSNTLLLPNTLMPINANLKKNEPIYYKDNDKRYIRMKRDGVNPFILHDGPPYANGDIHIGHALNKILKDFVVKFQYFNGRAIEFVPGWDCHGLPIEKKVKHKISNNESNQKTREHCRIYAARHIEEQKNQFKSLGVLADWDNHYETMSAKFETMIFNSLRELHKKELISRRKKPVFWSWKERTALAEAEVEYQEKMDESVYVLFFNNIGARSAGLLVWTTTPWTLAANVAVAANPYQKCIQVKGVGNMSYQRFWIAEDRFEELKQKKICDGEIFESVDIASLTKHRWSSPISSAPVPLILDEFVSRDTGTGFVHIAPGHGEDDYRVALKNKLQVIMPVGPDGKFNEQVVYYKYKDKHVFDCNNIIIEDLKKHNCLIKTETIFHNYPYCSRSNTPIIFRATDQWFLDLDTIRNDALKQFENIEFYPDNSANRMKSMLQNRVDWCISRQRDWGVPIALVTDRFTKKIANDNVHDQISRHFEEKTTDIWKTLRFPDNMETCDDILDVWFDSGLTWKTLNGRQADVYLEGNDQHRGWFQSSLWLSIALTGKLPFKKIITHGFVVDKDGQKMSKSQGNIVSPKEVIDKYGAEVLRYWVASTDYTKETKIGDEILKVCAESYRKIRNTLRFLVSNLREDQPKPKSLYLVDRWIINQSKDHFDKIHQCFSSHEYWHGIHILNDYIAELSSLYMNATKDRLYCDKANSDERESCLYTMAIILENILPLIAPIFTYTADEVLSYAPNWLRKDRDIFDFVYSPMEKVDNDFDGKYYKEALIRFHAEFDKLRSRKEVKDTLEVLIETNAKTFYREEDWFAVSGMRELTNSYHSAAFLVNNDTYRIVKSPHNKCQRCWKRIVSEDLCKRCEVAIHV